jgi:hypothetical protein
MAAPSNSRRAIATAVTVAVTVAAVLWVGRGLLAFRRSEARHPTDRDMLATFQRHRAEFDRLRDMILQDHGLLRVDPRSTSPEDPSQIGISRSRIAEYRALLNELGLSGGIAISEDRTTIELTASTEGFVTLGSEKGYAYSKRVDPRYVVDDLDAMSSAGNGAAWRRIDDGWYLYFEGT